MSSDPKQIKKLYYSIGEVSKMTELKAYVLRYWETEFKQLKPPKNRAGNRTYRQNDIDLILFISNKDYEFNKLTNNNDYLILIKLFYFQYTNQPNNSFLK